MSPHHPGQQACVCSHVGYIHHVTECDDSAILVGVDEFCPAQTYSASVLVHI